MKKFVITFRLAKVDNFVLANKLRSKIENLSLNNWVHILDNQLIIQTDKTIEEIYSSLLPEARKTRISIAEFNDIFINDNDFDYELTDKGY